MAGADPSVDLPALFGRVVARYRDAGRHGRFYVAMKLRRDPVHADIIALAQGEHLGRVVDIGCGRGQLAVALLEAGLACSVLGLDWHAAHLAQGQAAGNGLAFQTIVQDAARGPTIPECDTIVIVDVLYQLATAAQHALLRGAAQKARRKILIRTLDPDRGARSLFTRALEMLWRGVMPNTGAHVNPPPISVIVAALAGAGFAVSTTPCWRGTPFANVLVIARREERGVHLCPPRASSRASSRPAASEMGQHTAK